MAHSETTADVIVIGGGAAGLSTAMQLAKRDVSVLVLEREQIGNGSTGRAAGLLGQLRGTPEHTRMLMDAVGIVKELEAQTGTQIFTQTGSVRVAETPARAQEIVDLVTMGKGIGFDIDHLRIDELARYLPYMKTDDLLDACYCPTDGHLQPAELVAAYVKVGKQRGVGYISNCPVLEIAIDHDKPQRVETARGTFFAPTLVNAAGPWSYLVAGLAAETLPTAALRHIYLTTEPDPRQPVDRFSPAVRDRHHRIYSRPEEGGLIVGIYGRDTVQYDMENMPLDFDMSAMTAAADDIHVATLIHAARQRFPWINQRTPMRVTSGIMTFTPDGKPFCGKLPDLEGFYHCTGFSGHGIMQSPTMGVIMAQLILDGRSTYDIAAIEADRYFDVPGFQARDEIKRKCYEMHASYYGRLEGGGGQGQSF